MNKTLSHQIMEAEVRAAERALHQARLLLEEKRRVLREYRASKRKGDSTRIGAPCLLLVADALSVSRKKRPRQIAEEAGKSVPATRKALAQLVAEGRAKRLGKRFQHTFYMAIPQREAAE